MLVRQSTIDAATGVDLVPILIYLRISRDPEGRKAGVERQDEDNRALAATIPGGRIEHVYCDNDISASTNHDVEDLPRPDYDKLLAHAVRLADQYGRCLIIAWTTARLTRRPAENEDMIRLQKKYRIDFLFCKSGTFDVRTASGAFHSRIMAAVDAKLPEEIREQAVRAKVQAAVEGIHRGGARPFGYRIERDYSASGLPVKGSARLVVVEAEAACIRSAAEYVIATPRKPNLCEIARQWDAAGMKPTQGDGPWCQSSVRRVLLNPKLAGRSVRRGVDMGAARWPAILTEDQQSAVRVRLNEKGRRCNPSNVRTRLGSGMWRCGTPGCTDVMRSSGANYRGRDCGHSVIAFELVDTMARGVVCSILKAHGAALLAGHRSADLERLTQEANTKRARIKALALAFAADDRADPVALATATAALRTRLAEIAAEQADLMVSDSALLGVADAADPVRAFLAAPLDRQRAVCAALIRVTVLPGKSGRVSAAYRAAHPLTDRVVIVRQHAE